MVTDATSFGDPRAALTETGRMRKRSRPWWWSMVNPFPLGSGWTWVHGVDQLAGRLVDGVDRGSDDCGSASGWEIKVR
jgi:hypothetical protein